VARPLRIEYENAFYHVTSRGNEQKDIFKTDRDREKFLEYLGSASERYGAVVHAYCLMSNHYHLLVQTPQGNLSQIMRHINGAYTTYYNTKRKRFGHLLQGRYKAILVDKDAYAQELSRYIHLNPLRAGMAKRPEEYVWSSYRFYISGTDRPKWLHAKFIHAYFSVNRHEAEKRYRKFVEQMLGREYESPLKKAVESSILGASEFVVKIRRIQVASAPQEASKKTSCGVR